MKSMLALAVASTVFISSVPFPVVAAGPVDSLLCPDTYVLDHVTVPLDFAETKVRLETGQAWVFMEESRSSTHKTGDLTGRTCTERIGDLLCELANERVQGLDCDMDGAIEVEILDYGVGVQYRISIGG